MPRPPRLAKGTAECRSTEPRAQPQPRARVPRRGEPSGATVFLALRRRGWREREMELGFGGCSCAAAVLMFELRRSDRCRLNAHQRCRAVGSGSGRAAYVKDLRNRCCQLPL